MPGTLSPGPVEVDEDKIIEMLDEELNRIKSGGDLRSDLTFRSSVDRFGLPDDSGCTGPLDLCSRPTVGTRLALGEPAGDTSCTIASTGARTQRLAQAPGSPGPLLLQSLAKC